MADHKSLEHWGRHKARERYSRGGDVTERFPDMDPWLKYDLEHSSNRLASGKTPMGFNVGRVGGMEPSENEAIKGDGE